MNATASTTLVIKHEIAELEKRVKEEEEDENNDVKEEDSAPPLRGCALQWSRSPSKRPPCHQSFCMRVPVEPLSVPSNSF